MAILNGHIGDRQRSLSPAQHIGKRKRTSSPEPKATLKHVESAISSELENALQILKRHDSSERVLKYPLPPRGEDGRAIKRQRTATPDQSNDSIEFRILNATYRSLDDLLRDVGEVKQLVIEEEADVNANDGSDSLRKQVGTVWDTLSSLRSKTTKIQPSESSPSTGDKSKEQKVPNLSLNQVLSLRSQTEHGIRQLFSGLPKATNVVEADGRKLPNGFELTEAITVDRNDLQDKESRKFGDVFAPNRNIKTLEMPRGNRFSRGNTIGFTPPFESAAISSRNDYKSTNLNTGDWLKYAITDKPKSEQNEKSPGVITETAALFKAAFSTFAPTTDNSGGVVSDHEKSQQWWRKNGKPTAFRDVFTISPITNPSSQNDSSVSDTDLEDMVANFIPEDSPATESEDVLGDVSELIETLISYQSIRNLEVARGPSSASKPTKDEQSIYSLLRDQLQLLVSSLPPFAVAKLNGHQLADLNISTNILVSSSDFVGTAQVDDYTLRRNRAAQAATSAVGRNAAPIPSRNTYVTPASAYNAQARAYNNIPSTAYTPRPPTVTMYSTPRPPTTSQNTVYGQSQFRPNGPSIHTPSVQQFQRPVVNGFGQALTQTPQSAYMHRAPQTGYQQRTQDGVAYTRMDVPAKPSTNGDASHLMQRQFAPPNHTTSAGLSNGTSQNHAPADTGNQRQASDTPQPQAGAAEVTAAAVA